jgi:putative heme-binding domain-containing protein
MFQRDDQWRSYTHRIGQERLLTGSVFTNPISGDSPELLLVAARCGGREIQPYLHDALTQSNAWSDYRLVLTSLRAAAVSFARHGPPSSGTASRLVTRLEEFYPAQDFRENEALCELLVYLHSTNVIARTLPLLDSAATQEEKLHYLFTLHHVKSGWTLEQRRTWFEWFARARREFTGGNSLPTMLNYLRAAMEATLSLEERTALADTLAALDRAPVAAPSPPVARSFVKEWTMDDLTGSLTAVTRQRDRARGRRLFAETGCLQCHRYGRDGGTVGPDLTAVSSRFDRRAVLESLIEPSLVVAEVYRPTVVALKNGEILHGRILAEDAQSLTLATNPTDPDRKQRLPRADIVSQKISELSPMPTGLLNTLTRDEVLDLLSWIEFGGDAEER